LKGCRNIMNRRFSALTVTIGLCVALAACGDDTSTDSTTAAGNGSDCTPKHEGLKTIEEGKLSVAAYVYPPFSDVKGQELGGAEGEIVTRIAEMECLDIKVVPGAAAAMIPSIVSKRADTTIGSWYRTAEREKVVRLGAPVIADQLSLISKSGVGTIDELKGKKVGSILGFLWNDDLKKVLGGDVKFYDTATAMYADLAAGRIEVIVDTYPSGQAVLKTTPIAGLKFVVPPANPAVLSTVKPGQTEFPASKDNAALGEAMDENIAELRASGELKKIVVKHGFQPEAADPGEPNLL
jgi:polar amino acid transport system substrate-binding protein